MNTPVAGDGAEVDEELESALLAYKQRKAARWGAERFADELRRRDEAEESRPVWTGDALSPPVEASVEAQVVGGDPVAFRPEPPRIGFDPIFVVEPPQPLPLATIAEPSLDETPEPVVVGVAEIRHQPEEEPQIELDVEPEAVAPPVELPRFVPDAAWSAGSPSGRRERLPAALRHPNVPRPPASDPAPAAAPARRRWRGRRGEPESTRISVVTTAEWARMSPGARRLYGIEDPPEQRRVG
jgi:hypothetical protein